MWLDGIIVSCTNLSSLWRLVECECRLVHVGICALVDPPGLRGCGPGPDRNLPGIFKSFPATRDPKKLSPRLIIVFPPKIPCLAKITLPALPTPSLSLSIYFCSRCSHSRKTVFSASRGTSAKIT
jgi:hypothetical protein